MDFNTGGGSGRPEDRPLFGEEAGGRPAGGSARGPAGSPGGEFNLQDPINSFIGTVRAVVLSPVDFFRGMARRGDFVGPLIFALICYEVSAILAGLIGLILNLATGAQAFGSSIISFVAAIIVAPIVAAVILAVTAGVLHLMVMLVIKPLDTGFETTFRTVSYSFVTRLVTWIPGIGTIVGFIWYVILLILGIRETHDTTTGKAAIVVLIPVVIAIFILLLLAVAIGALIFTLLQQQ